jgi:hypothetical protein
VRRHARITRSSIDITWTFWSGGSGVGARPGLLRHHQCRARHRERDCHHKCKIDSRFHACPVCLAGFEPAYCVGTCPRGCNASKPKRIRDVKAKPYHCGRRSNTRLFRPDLIAPQRKSGVCDICARRHGSNAVKIRHRGNAAPKLFASTGRYRS